MKRDHAILCGLLVKACKLGKAIVAMSAHLGLDRQLALFRELIEALATLRYSLEDPGDGSRLTDDYKIFTIWVIPAIDIVGLLL
jgi:hypothetical protein